MFSVDSLCLTPEQLLALFKSLFLLKLRYIFRGIKRAHLILLSDNFSLLLELQPIFNLVLEYTLDYTAIRTI